MNLPLAAGEQSARLQLPSEVLDHVAELLYEGSCRQLDTLFAFSLVSKHFRKSTLPFLFRTVSHVVRDKLYQQECGLLRRLLENRHLLDYIHTLHVLQPEENLEFAGPTDQYAAGKLSRELQASDLRVIRSSLIHMGRLRRIRLDCSAASAHEIVSILASEKRLEIALDHLYTSSQWPDLMVATTDIASAAERHHLALGAFGGPPVSYPVPSKATFDVMSKAVAINLHVAWLYRVGNHLDEDTQPLSAKPVFKEEVSWTEVRLIVEHGERNPYYALRNNYPGGIPWQKLQRLEVVWHWTVPMSDFIHRIASALTGLRALRLRADHKRIFHPSCGSEAPVLRIFADPPDTRPFAIDYTEMQTLQELEIDGICNHIPITDLLGLNLRALRLHCEDPLFSVYSRDSQRSHNDILTAANLSPKLERLELDIGYIESLWHSVAIPGVDVDVEQYAFLNGISKFRHLKFLRLFPPFVAQDSPRDSRSVFQRTPIADDQAVRIFEHLHNECPALHLLSIAAIPSIMNVDTMFWEVKRDGEKTLLKTGHRVRNYEHRQTWIGRRRIRSEIKRFRTPPPYLPDFDGWLLTRDDRVKTGSDDLRWRTLQSRGEGLHHDFTHLLSEPSLSLT